MHFEIDLLGDLREKFMFLTFMTDQEIEGFLSVIGSVAEGTSISQNEILEQMERESCKLLAFC